MKYELLTGEGGGRVILQLDETIWPERENEIENLLDIKAGERLG